MTGFFQVLSSLLPSGVSFPATAKEPTMEASIFDQVQPHPDIPYIPTSALFKTTRKFPCIVTRAGDRRVPLILFGLGGM